MWVGLENLNIYAQAITEEERQSWNLEDLTPFVPIYLLFCVWVRELINKGCKNWDMNKTPMREIDVY
jgi:hypothetical protein